MAVGFFQQTKRIDSGLRHEYNLPIGATRKVMREGFTQQMLVLIQKIQTDDSNTLKMFIDCMMGMDLAQKF